MFDQSSYSTLFFFLLGRLFISSLILCNVLIFYTVGRTDLLHLSLTPRLKNFPGISYRLSEVSKFRHHTKQSSKCSSSLFFPLNMGPLTCVSENVPLCNWRINFLVYFCGKIERVSALEEVSCPCIPQGLSQNAPLDHILGRMAIVIRQKACKLQSTGPYYYLATVPLVGCDFRGM